MSHVSKPRSFKTKQGHAKRKQSVSDDRDSRAQTSQKLALVMGFHALNAVLEARPSQVVRVYLSQERQDQRMQALYDRLCAAKVQVSWQPRAMLDEACPGERHQGVVAWLAANEPQVSLEGVLAASRQPRLLCLDQVQDPHNLGACLRLAAAFGFDAIIVPRHGSVDLTSTVRKVASGAEQHVPVVTVTNLNRAIETMQAHGLWVYGLAESGESDLAVIDAKQPLAIVMGAEGAGLRANVARHCDTLVAIATHERFVTLNVSTAAAVVLHHVFVG